jgi:hypothetical protein
VRSVSAERIHCQKGSAERFDMSSLAEIQEAIEKLTSEERARLRKWFDRSSTVRGILF